MCFSITWFSEKPIPDLDMLPPAAVGWVMKKIYEQLKLAAFDFCDTRAVECVKASKWWGFEMERAVREHKHEDACRAAKKGKIASDKAQLWLERSLWFV